MLSFKAAFHVLQISTVTLQHVHFQWGQGVASADSWDVGAFPTEADFMPWGVLI